MNKKSFKYYLTIICCSFVIYSKAQLLLDQSTYKGGITSDGVSYIDFDYLQADTINFQTYIPPGSVIKKAILLSQRTVYVFGSNPKKEKPLNVIFNSTIITLDSSNLLNGGQNNSGGKYWVVSEDVTNLTTQTSNQLIIPCQGCLISGIPEPIVYRAFLLVIIYENSSFPLVNSAIFVANKNYNVSYLSENFTNLNPINNTNDVGLSIWTNNTCTSMPLHSNLNYTLQSSLGTFNLGTLDAANTSNTCKETIPGSFYYNNNTLTGLVDDTPDAFIDSTDALVDIKNYVSNLSTSLSLISTGGTFSSTNFRLANIFAYTSPCPASVSKDTSITICKGQNVQLNASSGFTNYNWYPLVGLNDSTIINPLAAPQQSTNYTAYVKDAAGCMHTEHTQIKVHGVPVPDSIKITNAVCATNLGSLLITPNYHNYQPYTYNIGNGATTDTNITNINPGTYTLTVTDNAGCTYQTDFEIDEIIPVNASISALPTSGTQPLTVGFFNNSTGANNYNWHFPTSIATSTDAAYTFTQAGTYTVMLVSYKNITSCSDTATVIIQVLPKDTSGVFIPNVFSPNGDGINETLEFKMKNVELQGLEIYDRWGLLIFSTKELQKTSIANLTTVFWDGRTTSGESCTEGTYFYIFSVKDEKEVIINYKGFVTLVR